MLSEKREHVPDDEFVVTTEAIDPVAFEDFKRLLALDVQEGFRLDLEDA